MNCLRSSLQNLLERATLNGKIERNDTDFKLLGEEISQLYSSPLVPSLDELISVKVRPEDPSEFNLLSSSEQ